MITQADKPALRVRGVSKRFGDVVALAGVSFDIGRGEVAAIIGSSGSGKSTLLRCIDLLEWIEAGSIEYAQGIRIDAAPGQPATLSDTTTGSHLSIASGTLRIRRGLGFVFQGYDLWEEKTVLENLILGPIVVANEKRAVAEARAEDLCRRFGLSDKLGVRSWQLSGGQRQRTAIIRALMMRPELLLLDEVTSSLDPMLTFEVMQLIRELKLSNMTMIVVTHHLRFASGVSDRIIFLSAGTVLQDAHPDVLEKSPATPEVERYLSILKATG